MINENDEDGWRGQELNLGDMTVWLHCMLELSLRCATVKTSIYQILWHNQIKFVSLLV